MEKFIQISEKEVEELADTIERVQEVALGGSPHSPEWETAFERLERAIWKFQVFSLSPLVQKMETFAQELGNKLQKQVQCEFVGFDYELPAPLRDSLSEILLHVIRNSVDHGIEAPEERVKRGKASTGWIHIAIRLERGTFRLVLHDDGAGPDFQRVTKRAIQMGLISSQEAQRLSVEEKLALLFRPGFSTQEVATSLSGRGMGLDVVHSTLLSLGGDATAVMGQEGGFELRLNLPAVLLGAEVVPMRIGSQIFFLNESAFEFASGEITAEEAQKATRLAQILGHRLDTYPKYLSLRSRDSKRILFAVDEVGSPVFKLFRRLDPMWKTTGPAWMKSWMDACEGSALACRMSRDKGQAFGLLADAALLREILREKSN